MFVAVIFIALGVAILLNALGILNSSFWGIFWGLIFLAVGIRMMMKRGKCLWCEGSWWSGHMHEKIHSKMRGNCCGGHEDNEEK